MPRWGLGSLSWVDEKNDSVTLVAHDGESCDFPYFAVELQRAGLQLPGCIEYCVDTLWVIKNKKKQMDKLWDAPN